MRRRLGPLALLVVLVCALGALTALLRPARADLVVVCSNTASVCDALAASYEERHAIRVDVVRVPTTEALARLAATGGDSEFDVWLGGPAEAHAEAERLGLLEDAPGIDASGLPAAFHSRAWFGIYGGVLALCTTPSARSDAASWAALIRTARPVLVPLPLTSGTAATMLNVHAERLGGIAESIPYLRALDAKVASYSDSGTDPAHLVAVGRAPIAVAFDTYCDLERAAGANVETVYPADGTGFEVGAASLPRTSRQNPAASDFLAWVVSDEGQALGASVAGQSPISSRLPGNLSARLDSLRIPLYGTDPAAASKNRSAEIAAWEAQVYATPRCGDLLGPSCDEVPAESGLDRVELAPAVVRTAALAAGSGLLAVVLGALIALGSGLVLLGLLGLALMGVVLRGLAGAVRAGGAARLLDEATRSSAVILLLVVPLSALVGLLVALLPRRRLPALDAAALLALLASPVAGEILVHLVLRRPLEIGGHQILPSLLGGASPGGGLVAVVLAHLLLAIPAAYFLMSFALSGTRRVRRAAEDAGAPRSREVLDVLVPVRAGRILAAIAALSALTMCMSAPAVFVVPAGSAFPAVALVPYGVHGSSGEVFTLGALGGTSALAMILLGLAALIPTVTRRPRA